MKTLFSTSNVTLFDRISEYFKMRKYMRRFERESSTCQGDGRDARGA